MEWKKLSNERKRSQLSCYSWAKVFGRVKINRFLSPSSDYSDEFSSSVLPLIYEIAFDLWALLNGKT
jgi:hypothetical protein